MKKLKNTLAKTQSIFCELVLRHSAAVDKSVDYEAVDQAVIDFEKAILDIRMKSFNIRKFNF